MRVVLNLDLQKQMRYADLEEANLSIRLGGPSESNSVLRLPVGPS